ncbi:unnamed protein product [Acanthosepion pharaonis]|uniref:Uncharacterized protein n=1 Tax=Acanthosepion pharaonis TaxID=158019 RepID=A0A812DKQ9_ACAPH|nr:unnamed protein product [Sepia pharaonis]
MPLRAHYGSPATANEGLLLLLPRDFTHVVPRKAQCGSPATANGRPSTNRRHLPHGSRSTGCRRRLLCCRRRRRRRRRPTLPVRRATGPSVRPSVRPAALSFSL